MNEHELENLLRDALAEPRPPEHALSRVRDLMPGGVATVLAAWLESARNLLAEIRIDTRARPALAGFRSASTQHQVLATAGAAEVFIQIDSNPEAGDAFRLSGQLECPGANLDRPVAAIRRAGGVVESAVRAGGDGVFEMTLQPGVYDLAIGLDPPFLVPGLDLT
jgi:hypothetical protein